jgi:photosystem II stability/assembly factor-like uncharacterized protein
MKKFTVQLIFLFSLMGANLNAQNWESLDSGTDFILFDISFAPGQSEIGFAGGMQYTYDADGIVIKTEDGGDTWTQILPNAGTMDGIEAVSFPTTDIGYIAGWNNYIAKTIDGGETWNELNVGSEVWFFQDLEFLDENNGVAVGYGGEIYVTENGGTSWTSATGINQGVEDVAYASSSILYAVGGDEKISKSIDGGYTWTEIYTGTFQRYFMGVDFEGDFGVVGGEDGKIMHTNNGGVSWSTYATGYHNFQGIDVLNASIAYIGGTDEDIYKTIDGGSTWEVEYNGMESSHIYKVKFTTDGIGFACGSQGLLLRKTPAFVADFYADHTDICAGDTVHFYDNSSETATSWEWIFEGGDPETSSEENPVVVYDVPGYFDVQLTIGDGSQTAENLKEDYIMAAEYPAPVIDGAAIVCDFQVEEYTTSFNEESTYDWQAEGGSITNGAGTHLITVVWGGEGNGSVSVTETNPYDCETIETMQVLIDDCTGIQEYSAFTFDISPNPALSEIHIDFKSKPKENLKVIILNSLGQIVYKSDAISLTVNPHFEIDVSFFQKGVYILRIEFESGKTAAQKFIKD